MSDTTNDQAKVLAQAMHEIRLLLSDYLGSENAGDLPVRQAAHLAYALHNEAASVAAGGTFDVSASLAKINAVDEMLGSRFGDSVAAALSS
jgi:hypothetical protein